MHHGTPYGGFTVFKSASYFTQDKNYADKYQNPSASSLRGRYSEATNPTTYDVYLNMEKPFDTRNATEREIFDNEYYRKYGTGAPLSESGLPDWTDGMDLQDFIEEMEYDYDGLILDEGGVGGYGDGVTSRGLSYVVFDPSQVKNVSNKQPTSDPDIRFSRQDDGPVLDQRDVQRLTRFSDSAATSTCAFFALSSVHFICMSQNENSALHPVSFLSAHRIAAQKSARQR